MKNEDTLEFQFRDTQTSKKIKKLPPFENNEQ